MEPAHLGCRDFSRSNELPTRQWVIAAPYVERHATTIDAVAATVIAIFVTLPLALLPSKTRWMSTLSFTPRRKQALVVGSLGARRPKSVGIALVTFGNSALIATISLVLLANLPLVLVARP